MLKLLLSTKILTLITTLCISGQIFANTQPKFTVFTYADNPSTTITVNWQTKSKLTQTPSVHCSTVPRNQLSAPSEQIVLGNSTQIKGLKGYFYHRVHLSGLKPNTTYYLNLSDGDDNPLAGSTEYKIRTIPDGDEPIRFITGGDMGTSEDVRTLLRHAASWNPDFVVVGGDVAYANGKLTSVHLWDKWLTYYTEEMTTSEGYSIPLIVGVGNHETSGSFERSFKDAPFLPALFSQDMEKNHFSRRFGKNLGLLMLDTNHTASHESQVPWIRNELEKFKEVTHTAAVYHVPLYPSHRGFMEKYSEQGRKHWAPVFDEMELTVAFENHDHTCKRTHLLKGGKISTNGTGSLFLGDGCWGREARTIDYGGRWYLKECTSAQHFWCVDVSSGPLVYRAVDIQNRVFDLYPEDHPEAKEANKIRDSITNIYMLPAGCVSSTGYTVTGQTWKGGPAKIKVTNSFDHPMTYTLHPAVRKNIIQASGFTNEKFTLAPGKVKTHTVTFKPKGNNLPLARTKVSFNVNAEMQRPGEKPIEVYNNFKIPIRAKK